MKNNASPGVIIAAIVVVLLIVGFAAYKTFGGDPTASNISPKQLADMKAAKSHDMTARRDASGHPIEGTSEGTAPQKPGQ